MGGPKPVSVSGATYLKIGNRADGGFNPWGPWNHEEMDAEDFALAMIRCDNGASLIVECRLGAEHRRRVLQDLDSG